MEREYFKQYVNSQDDRYIRHPDHIANIMGYSFLVEQYNLIQKKMCKLPAMQRAAIVEEYERTHNSEPTI